MNHEKLKNIKLLLLDVDGVLTNGAITYDDNGMETKTFNVRDGLGLRLLMDSGISVGIVTGRKAGALMHRCRNLGIELVLDGIREKGKALPGILERTGVLPEEIAFMGDDLVDLPLMNRVGLSVAVADAHGAVASAADMVTEAPGGGGAVRELCEKILAAKGLWSAIMEKFK